MMWRAISTRPCSVVVRSDVHPAAVTALDVIYLDPPPLPSGPAPYFNGAASPVGAGSIAAAADVGGAPGPAVLLASASHDMVCVYSVGFDKSMLSLLATAATPCKVGRCRSPQVDPGLTPV